MTTPRTLSLVLALASSAAALPVPPLTGRVNDRAGLLSPSARAALENKLGAFERRTGHQLAVLILPSLEGEPLEPYSLAVIRTWGLGRKGVNDGVLLLVAKNDRRMRVEVGHGLEGMLPDALAGRIVADVVAPSFKAGDFERGIAAGTDAIMAAADGRAPPLPRASRSPAPGGILFLGFILFLLILRYEMIGITEPGGPAFHYLGLMAVWALFFGLPLGTRAGICAALIHAVGFPLARRLYPYRRDAGDPLFGFRGGWSSDSSGGSSGSSSTSSGGSDFSGGGGSSGGGGASGSW